MTRRIIIESGAAETRAALLINDEVWKFWFGPARGDEELDAQPQTGRQFAGKVTRVDPSLNAAFVNIGDKLDAFLPLNKSNGACCVEGATIMVEIKSPPRQQKGAVLRFIETLSLAAPERLPPFADAAVEAVQDLGGKGDAVIVDDGEVKKLLADNEVENVSHDSSTSSLFQRFGADAELIAAFGCNVALPGGGVLTIDENQALTSIDVDTAGLAASSSARLREKIAIAAASEAIRQISLRNIGGHVVIDFPKIQSDAARKRFQEHLFNKLSMLDNVSAAGFSKSGLFSFTLPHKTASLLERHTQPARNDPMDGRCFKVEFLAKRALRELENQLRFAPSGRFELMIGSDLDAYLTAHMQWSERLREKYGSRFEIRQDPVCGERNYDLGEKR